MSGKPVIFTRHARSKLSKRGVSEEQVIQTIREAPWRPSVENRLECEMEFEYNAEWNGRFYQTKKVRPVFVEEDDTIIVITVFSFYY